MIDKCVGVLGARSLIGEGLLPMLVDTGWEVTAFSRQLVGCSRSQGVAWRRLPDDDSAPRRRIARWIILAPIWTLPELFPLLERHGAQRVVAVSSTSRFTKLESPDARERAQAARLVDGERKFQDWATRSGRQWIVLRPTLIHGFGRDGNVSQLARFIGCFGFFPLFGDCRGLRQPIHAGDVAGACIAAMSSAGACSGAYNLSGGETLSYREMVSRVFSALGRRPRLIHVPLWTARLALSLIRLHPRFSHWSTAMAERTGQDLVFDHGDALRAFGFSPSPFILDRSELQGNRQRSDG